MVGATAYYLSTTPSTPQKKELVFGAAISQTGSYGPLGSLILKGYRLWEKDVNDRGGILGIPVRIVAYDDNSDPTTTKALYERLITVDKVDFLLGPYASACALQMAPVAESYKMVTLQPINNAKKLYTSGWEYQFLVSLTGVTDQQLEPYLQFYSSAGGANRPKTIGIVETADVYPKAVADGVEASASKYGFTVLFREQVPKGATDVTAAVQKLKEANPDVVFYIGYFAEEILLIRTAKEMDYQPKVYAAPEILQSWPQASTTLPPETMNYMSGHTGYSTDYPFEVNQYFVNKFHEMFGVNATPSRFEAAGWDAAIILEAAIKGVGQWDSTARDKIRDWLLENTVQTPSGPWQVDKEMIPKGYKYVPKAFYVLDQVLNGTPRHVWPADYKQAEFVYPAPGSK